MQHRPPTDGRLSSRHESQPSRKFDEQLFAPAEAGAVDRRRGCRGDRQYLRVSPRACGPRCHCHCSPGLGPVASVAARRGDRPQLGPEGQVERRRPVGRRRCLRPGSGHDARSPGRCSAACARSQQGRSLPVHVQYLRPRPIEQRDRPGPMQLRHAVRDGHTGQRRHA
jgi:hypothetical protein